MALAIEPGLNQTSLFSHGLARMHTDQLKYKELKAARCLNLHMKPSYSTI